MRLLERQDDGGFGLTENLVDKDISRYPYAILSHRWGQANEEITFEDIQNRTGQDKAGYRKIEFCGEQASKDGLKYFWVDSCCIKKSSDPELSEAINSMYRWYSRASRCYVYLSDVSILKRREGDENAQSTWEMKFKTSEWFSRGWTLQELLAPTSVEFFSRERERLGDRQSLSQQIHEITGITLSALEGTSLSQFSVDERFKWTENRHTTREEDQAYCLFGIFGISMPLIYGEGRERATRRLMKEINEGSNVENREIILEDIRKRLPIASDAPFNSLAKQHEPSCLPKTRTSLLEKIYNWADGREQAHIFWLNGWAGTGKSTIARTIARKYFDRRALGASFFFSRGGGDVGNASKFVTSIAAQLASNVHALRRPIFDALKECGDIASLSLHDQWQTLVLSPLSKLEINSHRAPYILVVDALDECQPERDTNMILQIISKVRALKEAHLRIFLTSRPEIQIRYRFSQMPELDHQDIILQDIPRSIVDHDIFEFLQHNLTDVARGRSLKAGWPGREKIECMVQVAGGLFIWAATACKFIREGRQFAARRLDTILQTSGSTVTVPEQHLDEIYTTVLEHSIPPEFSDEEKEAAPTRLKHVLGSIVVLFSQLSVSSLCELLFLTNEDVNQILDDLHSILDVPKDETNPLRLHHPSFRDFLLNRDRCKHPNFWVDQQQAHQTLAYNCLQLMSKSLKEDICDVKLPGSLATSLESCRVKQCIPPELQYACLYWIQHLKEANIQLRDNDYVHKFLEEHFLHWLEALSWLGRVSEGVLSNILLESIALSSQCPNLYALTHDMKRFALYFRPVIEQCPIQVYSSALVFAPTKSQVRRRFEGRIPKWIRTLPSVAEQWNAAVATLEGHSSFVSSVAFSPDGKRLASGSHDRTVRLWDGESGAAVATLEGHSDFVHSVAFSPDGKRLASGSWDYTVRLWDGNSGAAVATLEGHSGFVYSIAFSPDSKRLASGSRDATVRLWDSDSGTAIAILKGHNDFVSSITFSPDGKRIASGSRDSTVRLWDGDSGAAIATLESHSSFVSSIAFSPDGKRLASGSGDTTVKLWDGDSGKAVATLEGHSGFVQTIAFSPGGKRLASKSHDGAVKLWDNESGIVVMTLESYSDSTNSIAFSPDGKWLVSASRDGTIRRWNSDSGAEFAVLEGHRDIALSITFSPDGKRLASGSTDHTVRLWDIESDMEVATSDGHSNIVKFIAFSPDGKQLASGSRDYNVMLWDGESGAAVTTLRGHRNFITCIAFSPNGERLASGSADGTVRLWDSNSWATVATLEGNRDIVDCIAFSLDGKRLASGVQDYTIRLWDIKSGAVSAILKGHILNVDCIAFSPDGKRLATGARDHTVKVWDSNSGAVIASFLFPRIVKSLDFSPDGKRAALGMEDGAVRITDAGLDAVVTTIYSGATVTQLSFSSDGAYLNTNRGIIKPEPDVPLALKVPDLVVSHKWIMLGRHKLLWLPDEYRGNCVAVNGQKIGLGHSSGCVSYFRFDLDKLT